MNLATLICQPFLSESRIWNLCFYLLCHRWPLLVDISTQAVTFLRYRDTNYLNVLNPRDVEKQTLRMALVGAIRYDVIVFKIIMFLRIVLPSK